MFNKRRVYNPFGSDYNSPLENNLSDNDIARAKAHDPLLNITPPTDCQVEVDRLIDSDPKLRGIRSDPRFPVVYSMLIQSCNAGDLNSDPERIIDSVNENPLVQLALPPASTGNDYFEVLKVLLPLVGGIVGYFVLKNYQFGSAIALSGGVGLSAFLLGEEYNNYSWLHIPFTNEDWLNKLITNAMIGIVITIAGSIAYIVNPTYLYLAILVIVALGLVVVVAKRALNWISGKSITDIIPLNPFKWL